MIVIRVRTTTFSAHYDGKDYRWTVNANFDTIALKRLDAYTVNTINKKDGKRVQTSRIVVSKDGKTLTNTQKGTNASGQRVNNVLVFDRQ